MLVSREFRLFTAHVGLQSLSTTLAGGFVGAYLLKQGFSIPATLATYSAILMLRFLMRFVAIRIVAWVGYRPALGIGALVSATQFIPLLYADDPRYLAVWVAIVAAGESLYWPLFHAFSACVGSAESRGREIAFRQVVGSVSSIAGPLAGGWLLTHFGPAVDFSIAAAFYVISTLPIAFMADIPAGPVPRMAETFRSIDRVGLTAFAADGWISSGLTLCWPLILFTTLGSHYDSMGLTGSASAVIGAVAGVICGRAIDRGQRDRFLVIVCLALTASFALRAASAWAPLVAILVHASGAVIGGLYGPVLMSVIYDRAKRSGAAYRFHLAAEAGWDVGASIGCLVAASVILVTGVPSLGVLPATLGIAAVYLCVRSRKPKSLSAGLRTIDLPDGMAHAN